MNDLYALPPSKTNEQKHIYINKVLYQNKLQQHFPNSKKKIEKKKALEKAKLIKNVNIRIRTLPKVTKKIITLNKPNISRKKKI
jgi:DNA-directed RNA polymerase specialized sigma54-like protein